MDFPGFAADSTDHRIAARVTVAERLGISNPDSVGAHFYSVGTEPVTTTPQVRAAKAASFEDSTLEPFKPDMKAGVSDAAIAKQAKTSVAQVRKWRLKQGVRHTPGRPTAATRVYSGAIELLGRPSAPVALPVAQSPVLGRWEAPQYVLRQAMDYEGLVRIVDLASARFSADEIASALGLRKVDVVIAQRLGERIRHA